MPLLSRFVVIFRMMWREDPQASSIPIDYAERPFRAVYLYYEHHNAQIYRRLPRPTDHRKGARLQAFVSGDPAKRIGEVWRRAAFCPGLSGVSGINQG